MSRTAPTGTPLGDAFHVYDTTLRDGAQREGISYSVADKLAVARHLDALGVGFIEGGWPGALPKDTEFFARAAAGELQLRHAALVAFGATRKAGVRTEDDPQVRALLASEARVVTLVAKSDRRHIERALRTDVVENCAMVADTVALLRAEGRRVFLDAEHFFDGFQFDPDTALRVLDAAMTAGADVAVLCDTNGGMLPLRLAEIVGEVADRTGFRLGIHCQDDTGCAVANSVAAVQAGASHVQCTANGYGERAGNADLFAVVGNLVTKLDMPVLPDGAFAELTRTSHALAEIANIAPDTHQAYVGASAFAHKAGLHASAIKVDPELYNHMDPTVVGNGQRVLVTEMAGRASVELKGIEFGLDLAGHPAAVSSVVATVKEREANGWSFEAAEASLELLMRSAMDPESAPVPPFTLESYRVIVERRADGEVIAEATVKMVVDGRRVIATEEGNGPVNALDAALRAALSPSCPWLDGVELSDYKVRILNPRRGSGHGTDAVTRVLVESTEHGGDRAGSWTTVGVHGNVVEASWLALVDALTFASMRQRAPLTAVR
ncbi:MAG: 2-isopropylmalate synthase [Pseudonocardiales bacterium]|jgi:2-isopropylmalate synthase|nr:2-isopropylmalate synthase/homocitrate synthase family protein [Pseudonocardia sp.]MDT7646582.1 2-isopropylmalate synthase [Pseudonocardiales bacterium]MDT7664700.1 2-isopropylmalate synthase [Pseudonocardiales bacterium]MDT7670980.1 2-isopropylmalate synthase [Pseudonocardiales bacterium]MDT7672749.1 2-isopropylmalate synthase [Pseudonocardiales bacterium]